MYKIILYVFLCLISLSSVAQQWISFGEDTVWRTTGSSQIHGLYNADSMLLVSGNFSHGGTVELSRIGKWDTVQWDNFDQGINLGNAYCHEFYNNELYIGGLIFEVNSTPNTEFIAKWDGTTWLPVPNSYGLPSNYVNDMLIYNGNLIIGGGFNAIGSDNNLYGIAAYDGNDYYTIGQMPDDVRALEIYNGELYAGGWWYSLKKYTGGTNWIDVGGNTQYFIQDMVVDTFNNFLYVGGGFIVVDDSIVTYCPTKCV